MLHNHQNVSHTGQRSGEPDLSHKKSRNVLVMSHVTQDQKVHGGVHKHLCTSAARIPTPGSASYTAVITMNLPKPNTAGERGHPDGQVLDMQTSLSTDRQTQVSWERKQEREETRFKAVPKGEYWGKPNKINMVHFQQMPAVSVNINIK